MQEIGAAEDAPDDIVFERLQETAFPDQPVGRSILGTRDTVRSFDRRKLRAYLDPPLPRARHGVAAAGAVDHAAVVAEVERRFAAFNGPSPPEPERAHFVGGIAYRDAATSSRCISRWLCQASRSATRDLFSLQVFTSVLGGGMSSRLFQEVREIRGLCYSIYAFHAPYSDTGMFGLYAGTDADGCARADARRGRRDRQCGRDHHRGRDRSRQGADEGGPPDGAGKFECAAPSSSRAR